jgi:hypothetical protein
VGKGLGIRRVTGLLAGLAVALLGASLSGCAGRVPVRVPAAPSVHIPGTAVAIVAVDRECRDVADALADALGSIEGMTVRPGSPNQIKVHLCRTSWVPNADEQALEGRAVAVGVLSTDEGVVARLLGSSRAVDPFERTRRDGSFQPSKRVGVLLQKDVALDLAEQVAPVSTVVRRRVYDNPGDNSARHFHNLAVAAEREGRLGDALWWAQLAWERRPTPRSARYVSELTRRVSRTDPETSDMLTSRTPEP